MVFKAVRNKSKYCLLYYLLLKVFSKFTVNVWVSLWYVINMKNYKMGKIVTVILAFVLSIASIVTISLIYDDDYAFSPNKHIYEKMTEAICEGHLYIDHDNVDERLKAMENPYDATERLQTIGYTSWDYAFYNNHYYMYFGIVPVLSVFLPVKFLTGFILPTHIAVEVFLVFFIFGFFLLSWSFYKKYFKKIDYGPYCVLSFALCFTIIYCCIKTPYTYCLAIISALTMIVWCLCLSFKAVYFSKKLSRKIILLFCAAVFGALSLSCRPTVFIYNLLFLVILKDYLFSNEKLSTKILTCFLLCIPYIAVAICQGWYNYARFDNIFEFGASYQLTDYDQLHVFSLKTTLYPSYFIPKMLKYLIRPHKLVNVFPYITFSGLFVSFPLFLTIFGIFIPKMYRYAKKNKTSILIIASIILLFTSVFLDSIVSPYAWERYYMEFHFCVAIALMLLCGNLFMIVKKQNLGKWKKIVYICSCVIFVTSFLIMISYDRANMSLFNLLVTIPS